MSAWRTVVALSPCVIGPVVLYAFWIFFAGLIWYLQSESRREGYPLESDLDGIGVRRFQAVVRGSSANARDGGADRAVTGQDDHGRSGLARFTGRIQADAPPRAVRSNAAPDRAAAFGRGPGTSRG